MRILVISGNYPSPHAPQMGAFVYNIVQEFVKQGAQVSVIAPVKYALFPGNKFNYGSESATVYRPKFISLSNKKLGPVNTFNITHFLKSQAVRQVVSKIDFDPDVVYCHFIVEALTYFKAFPDSRKKIVIAVGEYHNIDVVRNLFNQQYYFELLERVKGFIAVSPQVKEKLLKLGVKQDKIIVEPNAVDLTKFRPRNKKELRLKYGLPMDKKLVLFVGRFLENKGPLRVQQALDFLGDDVAAIFIGKGPQQVTHKKILFSGTVEHNVVAEYMALSDVFVLPTLHEGSSNVIVEAMASGLPIVSSDIPEVRVQCDVDYSILVDPMDVDAIGAALNRILSNDSLREKMSKNTLEASARFDIKKRSGRILDFIQAKCNTP